MVGSGRLTCDVVVAGAGPSGAAAAIICARHGLDTVLIGAPARPDPCRPLESLNFLVRTRLETLGASHALDAASVARFTCVWVDGIRQPAGPCADDAGHHVDRALFDLALDEAAQGAGVRRLTVPVRGLTSGREPHLLCADGREVWARWMIDATGRARKLARLFGIRTERWSPPLIGWTGILPCGPGAHRAGRTSFDDHGGLWLWRTSRVGAGRTWTTVCPVGAPEIEIARLRARSLPGSARGRRVDWELARTVVHRRTILVGDAAGTLDPATGQGVLNALSSGIAAAETVSACLAPGGDAAGHAALYNDWFAGGLRDGAAQLDRLYRARGISWHID